MGGGVLNCPVRPPGGFTLMELAVVLAVLALLIGSLTVPLSMQIEQQRIRETRKTMDEIREALLGFAVATGRLPCPADPDIAAGQAHAGEERSACATPASGVGVVPWVTLGVAEGDAWGRRFSYRVACSFADVPPAGSNASFALGDTGNGDVHTKSAGGNVATQLPAVVVSHGPNGLGGYQQSSGIRIAWGPAGADERENGDANADFVLRTPTAARQPCDDGGAAVCEFDDLVAWVPTNILLNRMVAAGRLP